MANPYLSGRIPPELMEKVEQRVKDTEESKTDIIINAVSAYLGFPIEPKKSQNSEIWDAIAEIKERLSTIEKLNKQPKIVEALLSDNIQNDNKDSQADTTKINENAEVMITDVIQHDNNFLENEIPTKNKLDEPLTTGVIQPDNNKGGWLDIDNKKQIIDDNEMKIVDNRDAEDLDGIIGPFNELNTAKYFGLDRNNLKYHRTKLEKEGKPLDTPKRVLHEGRSYNLICKGKTEGKNSVMWIAKPAKIVKKFDNKQETPLFTLSSTKVDDN